MCLADALPAMQQPCLFVLRFNIYAFQWTKVKWCFGNVFFHFTVFGLKMQTSMFFEEK